MPTTQRSERPVASPRRAAALLAREAQAAGQPLGDLVQQWARQRDTRQRRVACELAVALADDDPRSAMMALETLVDDAERTVRAAASGAAARIAGMHFEHTIDLLAAWRDAGSADVRRAAAGAAAHSAEPHRPERAPHLVRFAKPFLGDADPSVRRAVTGSTLPALLRAYPEAAFEALVECSTASDPRVLRDVALAFASPAAAPLAKRALIVLRKLALDERRVVWRAAAAATWHLGRQRPDIVRPELDRWLEDEARAKVAREALKYL